MISSLNGEVSFEDGLRIGAHSHFAEISAFVVASHGVSIPGWSRHPLGIHRSDHGEFEVHAIVGLERRVEALYLSHCHSFYNEGTPEDVERRIFHEGVIATDLRGQREFAWGQIYCRVESLMTRDWLWVVYSPFSDVPLHAKSIEMIMAAHEPLPAEKRHRSEGRFIWRQERS